MNLRQYAQIDVQAIVKLVAAVFADSEGETEGALIGRLASDLFEKTDEKDCFNFVAESNGQLVGSLFFSRLRFQDSEAVFILGPVAVRTKHQRQGIGQALIRHGLGALRDEGVRVAITYGDPNYYNKVGFRAISQEHVEAPYELSQPAGWLGQSLVNDSLEKLSGKCTCVEAFKDPAYW